MRAYTTIPCVFLIVSVILICTFVSSNSPRTSHHTYVIHLETEHSRDDNVSRLRKNADAELFVAIDGSRFNISKVRPFMDYTRAPGNMRNELRPGELGCLVSHLAIWERFSDSGGLCVEDDVVLSKKNVTFIREQIHKFGNTPVILLGFRSLPKGLTDARTIVDQEPAVDEHWKELRCPNYSTACYAMTSTASRALIGLYQRRAVAGALLPADDFLSAAAGVHHSTTLDGFAKCISMFYPANQLADLLNDGISTTSLV